MKALKLNHTLAQEVAAGIRSSTWRVNDDKDLHVNDVIQLIDKVKPTDPESWKVIGQAKIISVLEKTFAQIDQSDMEADQKYNSLEDMLNEFRGYYGPQVNQDTPVKIIRFSFSPNSEGSVAYDTQTKQDIKEIKLYADGGSRGNPGPSASGYVLLDMDDKIIIENGLYLGVTTNNQAEYHALRIGLEEAHKRGAKVVHVYMDSMLVVNQIKGIFKVRNRDLMPINLGIKQYLSNFNRVDFTHVPRELNKLADAMVNEVLDERDGSQQKTPS